MSRIAAIIAIAAIIFAGCSASVETASTCSSPCACSVERFAACGVPLPWLIDGPEPRPDLCTGFASCVAQCELQAPCDVLRRYADGTGIGPETDLWQCNKRCGVQ